MSPEELFAAAVGRPTIVCDVDGVLAFTAEATATAVNARFGLSLLAAEQRTCRVADSLTPQQADWLAGLARGSFFANLAPDFHALDALDRLHQAGFHVVVATERNPDTTRLATQQWLSTWDVACDDVQILGPGGKRTLLATYGSDNPAILIDDDPAKALTVARPGVQVWSPQRPWTPAAWQRYPNYWVFTDWTILLARLDIQEVSGHSH